MQLTPYLLIAGVCSGCLRGRDDEDSKEDSVLLPTGVFEIVRTTESEDDCSGEGVEVESQVRFFRVEDATRPGYRATTCGGDTEPDCPTRDSYVGESDDLGWQSLDYGATSDSDDQGQRICSLSASLLRLEPLTDDHLRYQQAQWQTQTVIPEAECTREAAIEQYEGGLLDCVGNTMREGSLLQ